MTPKQIYDEAKSLGLQQLESEYVPFLNYLAAQHPKIGIEIGCANGSSSLSLSHFLTKLISIDLSPITKRMKLRLSNQPCAYHHITEDSNRAREVVLKCLSGELADFIFIDGAHDYVGVKRDFYRYIKLLRKGGFVALHDIKDTDYHKRMGCYVSDFWAELKAQYKTIEYADSSESCGIGLVIF